MKHISNISVSTQDCLMSLSFKWLVAGHRQRWVLSPMSMYRSPSQLIYNGLWNISYREVKEDMETPRRWDFWLKLSGQLSIIGGGKKKRKEKPTCIFCLFPEWKQIQSAFPRLAFFFLFFFWIKVVDLCFNVFQLIMCLYNNSPLLSFALPPLIKS